MKTRIQPVDVTVLYTEGCAGTTLTIDLIKGVAREMDVPIRLSEILVQSIDQATELKFLGSPTVHVHGADIDPVARTNANYGLM